MLARLPAQIFSVAALLLALFAAANAQLAPMVEDVLKSASAERNRYVEVFQNLLAMETKTFEVFDKDGEVKKRRVVRSNLIVFRLENASDRVVEFRNVVEIDGKPIGDRDERVRTFFEKLSKSKTSENELERIEDESFRYDPDLRISGLTLFQGVALAENIRPAVRFELAGRENIGGNECLVLDYQQTTGSEFIRVNRGNSPHPTKASLSFEIEGKPNELLEERIRGKLWLDAATLQIRKELREVTVKPRDFPGPVVISRTTAVYRDSEFGILTPEKLVNEILSLDRKRYISRRDITATFEYSGFTKPDVEIKSAEVK
ncbi:MAG: hypothetical protein QUS14_13695 [Pyrinomonadaceae bacterium]|nr:hypothetical protein [Pyrinomonadaceae bacterium]